MLAAGSSGYRRVAFAVKDVPFRKPLPAASYLTRFRLSMYSGYLT